MRGFDPEVNFFPRQLLCVFVVVAKAVRVDSFKVCIPSPTALSTDPLSSSALTRPVSFKAAGVQGGILISQQYAQSVFLQQLVL